ncbi:ABC transporter permease [Phormidium sp. CLA17]|uniref:ABC transporter permease n=1 Tax=Leptolyngbya sp. Cla-17 TaxID=2803751 RepID=UPI0014909C45|nr:ABC transporter permease [Leptolyngbya sp. Cla-17]MBM0742278.1 ABC transporter permease [Leptolyngbya sp. Cla-17]
MSKSLSYQTASLAIALLLIAILIVLAGGSPVQVVTNMAVGAFGTPDRIARVVATLVPLLLCTSGLLFTFTAGLYNLGIEGQIAFGAIAATAVMRFTQDSLPPGFVIVLAILVGGLGGMLWGILAGVLNVYGRVNEIFAGLGLNFVADGLALYLVFGPWKKEGVASMSGTEPFPESLSLPTIANTDASPIALLIAIAAVILTLITLRGTYFGLQLRAVGQNLRASYVLGIPSIRQLLSAFAICGGFAGIAGALQVLTVYHRLIPGISSNLGFLSLLIAMLIGMNVWLILPVALFFSALNVGSLQLPLALDLESSLSGVIQGMLVLFILLGRGLSETNLLVKWRDRVFK